MSAECQICGADLIVKKDGRQECPECPLKMRIAELETELFAIDECKACNRIEDHNRLLREENERLRSRLDEPTMVDLKDLRVGYDPGMSMGVDEFSACYRSSATRDDLETPQDALDALIVLLAKAQP